jgi:hypothetical protein
MQTDATNPAHYRAGKKQPIDLIEMLGLNFNTGNAVKYACRAHLKGTKHADINKAIWYLRREQRRAIPARAARTIYLSGPISGLSKTEALLAFSRATEVCRNLGYRVVNPMTLAQASPDLQWVEYMEQDLTLLMLDCDAVYVLPGADQSNGARIELTVAVCLDMPIYHSDTMPPNAEDEKVELEVEEALNSSLADRIIWMAMGGLVVAVIYQLLEYLHRHA